MNTTNYTNDDNILFINKRMSALAVILFFICAAFVTYAFVITLVE